MYIFFFFNDTATTEIYTLSLHDALPICAGEPLGAEVHSALFDQVRTCDNHCEFCFIYQLPAGLRHSLYVKDDDYRLSFLYGNYRSEEHTSELQSRQYLVCRLLLEKKIHTQVLEISHMTSPHATL